MLKNYTLFFVILFLFTINPFKTNAQVVNVQDSLALVDLYNGTNGPNWTNHTNWLTVAPVSTWYGVTVASGKVIRISLNGNKMVGNISSTIANISQLAYLSLATNQLNGVIPSSLGTLPVLSFLDLSVNQLSGSIPSSLGNMPSFYVMYLYSNQLSGSIPTTFGNLKNASGVLDLSLNQLSGNLPPELGNMVVYNVALAHNQLTGPIPASFGNLSGTTYLNLSYNLLNGTIPSAISNTTKMYNLKYLDISNNQFTFAGMEAIAATYSAAVYSPQSIIPLVTNGNKLSVSVGGTLNNNIYNWYKDGVLVSTQIGDSTYTTTTTGNYAVDVKNTVASQLILYTYNINVADSLALVDLYNSTNGSAWQYKTNWLTTSPVSTWYGVTTANGRVTQLTKGEKNMIGSIPASLGNLTGLTSLFLDNSQLSGNIPPSLGNLANLKYLDLSRNQLSGSIPSAIGKIASLTYLNLGGNRLTDSIPSSIGNLTNLTSLNLDYNQLSGNIPSALGKLSNLEILYLDSNQLTNSIPSSLGNLSTLKYLDLSQNNLTGKIPPSFGNLSSLQHLYLYQNQLFDTIPSSIGNLSKLTDIELFYNNLSGNIPASLGNLNKLNFLILAFNELSGEIPSSLKSLTNLIKTDTSLYLENNKFTFSGLEGIAQTFASKTLSYFPQANIPIIKKGNLLSVSVGGTPANNTYKWYKDGNLIATKMADSTFTVTVSGSYNAVVTNNIATQLTLFSDTLTPFTDSLILPAKPNIEFANVEYTDKSGWTHYYFNNNTPLDITDDTLLLSLKKNGQNIGTIGDGTFAVKLAATASAGTNTGLLLTNPLINNTSGYWVMNRFWQVTPTQQPSSSVGVRFYYNNQDVADVNGSYPSHNLAKDKLIFYKATGGNPDPTTNLAGATKLTGILPNTYASDTTWTYHALSDTTQYAEYSVPSFSGGGGGATGDGKTITTTSPTILPLTLLNFSGNRQGNNNLLQWATSNEVGTKTFMMESSANGNNFAPIGNVAATGGGKYSFIDNSPIANRTYYRLKMIDMDGQFTYSNIIWISTTGANNISVYPNPVSQTTTLNISNNNQLIGTKAQLTDVGGRLLQQITINHSQEQLNMMALPAGLYLLKLNDGTVVKIMKQ